MTTLNTLFESVADRNIAHVEDVLAGRSGPWKLAQNHWNVLNIIRVRVGKQSALPLLTIASRTKLQVRTVKEIVQELRRWFRVQIGASRDQSGGGYYLISCKEEAFESTELLLSQAINMLRTVRVMRSDQDINEMLGQLKLALEMPEPSTPQSTGPVEQGDGAGL